MTWLSGSSINRMLVKEIPFAADDLLDALLQLDPARRVAILDSGGARGAEARFLIAGFDPVRIIEARGSNLHITERGQKIARIEQGSVLSMLDLHLKQQHVSPHLSGHQPSAQLPAAGACIATLSYDLVRRFERLRSASATHRTTDVADDATGNAADTAAGKANEADEPDAVLVFYDTLIIHDYVCDRTTIVSVAGRQRLEETGNVINDRAATARSPCSDDSATPPARNNSWVSNFTREQYRAAVLRIKEHIYAGDIYQANLTQQFTCPLAAGDESEQVFLRLRRQHPASFAAFVRRREDVCVSISPERFLHVKAVEKGARTIEAWPIKGTRPRGVDREDDARLRAELHGSEKDRAENIMIVDLMRNDLGRVCGYGSIEVTELCQVQEHPTLFHLVSKVRGMLRPDVSASDLIRATFPCGSITGAPKIRAMEIIDRVETRTRGLSMGAIGYFSFDGSIDLNVAIRTMVVRDRMARFNTGGGIVADSCPELEYEESLLKARALLEALNVGAGSLETGDGS